MDRSRPFIEVSVSGKPVSSYFYSLLSSASIRDLPGQDSDTCELTFDDSLNQIAMPPAGAIITVKFGFRDAGSWKMGVFEVEKPKIKGGADGEFLVLSGRSAATAQDLKEPSSEHFDDMTIGGIVEQLAGRHGYDAKVGGELASVKVPYIARIGQSPVDFLTRLADRHQALFAVKDRKFLFLPRGSLPALTIDKSECESWEFTVEPRPRHSAVESQWFDRATGKLMTETHSTGLQGPVKRLRTVLNSQAEAKAAAVSEGERLARATGTGSITLAGRPEAMADAPIVTTGFRSDANGEWAAASVDHEFSDTYMTTIELEAPGTGK